MKGLPAKLKIFLVSVYFLTIISTSILLYNGTIEVYIPKIIDIIVFGLFLAVSESFIVLYKNMAISTSFAVQLASLILFKPFGAILIIILGFSLRIVKHNGKYVHIFNTPLYKTIFNYCVLTIPMTFAGLVYQKLGGTYNVYDLWGNIHIIIVSSLVYFLLNTFLGSLLYSILHKKNILYFFVGNGRLSLLSSIVMTPFGAVLAYVFKRYGYDGMMLIVFPIVLVRYTFYLYIESKTQYIQTVDTLMHAMEARDKYTEGHSQRVAEIATLIAKQLRYSDSKIERLHMAALLHDVGKIGIDDNILNKPGRLTEEEYETIKSHPEIGYNILKDIKNLEDILPIVRNHHERYDGKGYPDGKTHDQLDLDIFIIQLADTVDAMATDRPYRSALTEEQMLYEINKYSGSQFHPKVVDAYLNILQKQKKAV